MPLPGQDPREALLQVEAGVIGSQGNLHASPRRSIANWARERWRHRPRSALGHDPPRLVHDGVEVALVPEALRVELVDVLRARGPDGEPAARRDDLQAADRLVDARRPGQLCRDRLAGQLRRPDRLGRERPQPRLLLGRRRRIDPGVEGRAVLGRQFAVVLAGVLAGPRGDLRRQEVEERAVLVGRPGGPVPPQEARPGALLAREAEVAVEQPRREPLEARPGPPRASGRAPRRPGR